MNAIILIINLLIFTACGLLPVQEIPVIVKDVEIAGEAIEQMVESDLSNPKENPAP